MEVGEAGAIPSTALSPPELYYIKMGSDGRHFNVSLYCGGQSHKTESLTTTSERGTSVFSLVRKTGSRLILPHSTSFSPNQCLQFSMVECVLSCESEFLLVVGIHFVSP